MDKKYYLIGLLIPILAFLYWMSGTDSAGGNMLFYGMIILMIVAGGVVLLWVHSGNIKLWSKDDVKKKQKSEELIRQYEVIDVLRTEISNMRIHGKSDQEITVSLLGLGWDSHVIQDALKTK